MNLERLIEQLQAVLAKHPEAATMPVVAASAFFQTVSFSAVDQCIYLE